MLELDEGQLSRPVLRGRGGSNTSLLPGPSVSGSSQRGRVCADLTSLVWRRGARGVGREAGEQWPGDGGDHPRFPGAKKWVAHSALSADLWAGWGQNAPKRGRKGGFFEVYHVGHIGATS